MTPDAVPRPAAAPRVSETPRERRLAFLARAGLAAAFAGAAVHHARAALADVAAPGAGRHGVFVLVDLLAALATFWPRPLGALALAALTAQQIASHGPELYASLAPGASLDLASLGSLAAVPSAAVLVGLRVHAARKAA